MRKLIKTLITSFLLSIAFINAGYFGVMAVQADRIQDVSGSVNNTFNTITLIGIGLLVISILIFLWILFRPIKEEQ